MATKFIEEYGRQRLILSAGVTATLLISTLRAALLGGRL
jgi:hypothetical protein